MSTTGESGSPDGWERHHKEQMVAILGTSAEERLRWLEAAIRFAYEVGALPRIAPGSDPTDANATPPPG